MVDVQPSSLEAAREKVRFVDDCVGRLPTSAQFIANLSEPSISNSVGAPLQQVVESATELPDHVLPTPVTALSGTQLCGPKTGEEPIVTLKPSVRGKGVNVSDMTPSGARERLGACTSSTPSGQFTAYTVVA